MKETELAAHVVAWLKEQHWEVYQEVSLGYQRIRADIVATQGHLIWVVETKLSPSLKLLDQAYKWTRYAHFVSVATEMRWKNYRRVSQPEIVYAILRVWGIGNMEIEDGMIHNSSPRLNRNAIIDWAKNHLNDKQKQGCAAGSTSGGYWTPFRDTCDSLRRYVRKHPGVTFREAVNGIKEHHYRTDQTAIACLRQWAMKDKIKGIRLEWDGRSYRIYPTDQSGP